MTATQLHSQTDYMWREELGAAFAGLLPERIDASPTTGRVESAIFGELRAR